MMRRRKRQRIKRKKRISPDGSVYEKLVQLINIAIAHRPCKVIRNAPLVDSLGNTVKIDVLVEPLPIGNGKDRIFFEVKEESRKVEVGDVRTFADVCRFLNAAHKVMVSKAGFQKAAVVRANADNIRLLTLSESDSETLAYLKPMIDSLGTSYRVIEIEIQTESTSSFIKTIDDTAIYRQDGVFVMRLSDLAEMSLAKQDFSNVEIARGGTGIVEQIVSVIERKVFVRLNQCLDHIFQLRIQVKVIRWPGLNGTASRDLRSFANGAKTATVVAYDYSAGDELRSAGVVQPEDGRSPLFFAELKKGVELPKGYPVNHIRYFSRRFGCVKDILYTDRAGAFKMGMNVFALPNTLLNRDNGQVIQVDHWFVEKQIESNYCWSLVRLEFEIDTVVGGDPIEPEVVYAGELNKQPLSIWRILHDVLMAHKPKIDNLGGENGILLPFIIPLTDNPFFAKTRIGFEKMHQIICDVCCYADQFVF